MTDILPQLRELAALQAQTQTGDVIRETYNAVCNLPLAAVVERIEQLSELLAKAQRLLALLEVSEPTDIDDWVEVTSAELPK